MDCCCCCCIAPFPSKTLPWYALTAQKIRLIRIIKVGINYQNDSISIGEQYQKSN